MHFLSFFKKIFLTVLIVLILLPYGSVFSAGGNFQPENTFVDHSLNDNDEVLGAYDIAVDTVNHRLFASDYANHRVMVFDLDASNVLLDNVADNVLGQVDFDEISPGTTNRKFSNPTHLVLDQAGLRLFVSDTGNNQ